MVPFQDRIKLRSIKLIWTQKVTQRESLNRRTLWSNEVLRGFLTHEQGGHFLFHNPSLFHNGGVLCGQEKVILVWDEHLASWPSGLMENCSRGETVMMTGFCGETNVTSHLRMEPQEWRENGNEYETNEVVDVGLGERNEGSGMVNKCF